MDSSFINTVKRIWSSTFNPAERFPQISSISFELEDNLWEKKKTKPKAKLNKKTPNHHMKTQLVFI